MHRNWLGVSFSYGASQGTIRAASSTSGGTAWAAVRVFFDTLYTPNYWIQRETRCSLGAIHATRWYIWLLARRLELWVVQRSMWLTARGGNDTFQIAPGVSSTVWYGYYSLANESSLVSSPWLFTSATEASSNKPTWSSCDRKSAILTIGRFYVSIFAARFLVSDCLHIK